jgi:hypothetical protein
MHSQVDDDLLMVGGAEFRTPATPQQENRQVPFGAFELHIAGTSADLPDISGLIASDVRVPPTIGPELGCIDFKLGLE